MVMSSLDLIAHPLAGVGARLNIFIYVLLQREVLEYKRVDQEYVTGLQEKWVNCG